MDERVASIAELEELINISEPTAEISITDTEKLYFTTAANFRSRAQKNGRVSDVGMPIAANIALKYFNNRCALSGEQFVVFDEKINTITTNLTAEHVISMAIGGDNIFPNLVPSVLQYNIQKNGYYILDWWERARDKNDKPIYNSYRLLKLINFMMKSMEARGKSFEAYENAIMTPNTIDIFLQSIEKEDEQIENNSARKILSDTITATTVTQDGKKILTEIPKVDGDILTQLEQVRLIISRGTQNMYDVFLTEAISRISMDKELSRVTLEKENGVTTTIVSELSEAFSRVARKNDNNTGLHA